MTYTLITANRNYSSWSLRPWILMQARDIPFADEILYFEEENYERFRAFAPNGQVPCLKDGDRTIWDSLAIAEYLAERNPGCWPTDDDARAWARSATAEMHGGFAWLRNICPMNVGVRATLHQIETPLQRNIDRIGGGAGALWRPMAGRRAVHDRRRLLRASCLSGAVVRSGYRCRRAGVGGTHSLASGDAGMGAAGTGRAASRSWS